MTDDIPKAVWSGSFHLLGVEVKCHVLDNGQRIIEGDSMMELLNAMADPTIDREETPDVTQFERWRRGFDA